MTAITPKMLRSKGACPTQLRIFKERWPEGAEVTLKNCQEAARLGLNFDWAAQSLLSAPARKAYREAIAPAEKAYREAIAPALKAYREAIAPAWKTYKAATAPAWKTYNEGIAPAFYAAWLIDHPVGVEE